MNERRRIMVVDDDLNIQQMINDTLDPEGFDTVIIADSDEALTILEKTDPDLVILDTEMSDLDGFQTLNLIREHSDVPVIMLSPRYEVESLQKALLMGADDYVKKPFSTRSFVARIQAKLRRARKEVLSVSKQEAPII